ncbi:hypothetical protein Tco_0842787, partial [Tanacetum coccineum]
VLVPLDLSKDTKPYVKLRSSRSVHWDQHLWTSLMKHVLHVENKDTFKRTAQPPKHPHKDYRGKYKALKSKVAILTKKIDAMYKNKSKKRLVVESFDWDEESLSSEDEGVTRVKSFMAIIEDETVVGKVDARSGQWVEITMKKIQQLMLMTDCDERKHVLDYTYSDLHYVKDLSKNLLSKFNSLKQELSSRNSELVDLKDAKVHVGIKRLFEAV